MIRSVFIFSSVFLILFLVSYTTHSFFLENQQITLPFSLKKVYLFHLGFSLIICTNFLFFSTVDKIFLQLGFIYLATIVLKLILFSVIFYQSIFTEEKLAFNARISLFIPMIVFLLTEAIFIAKILNKKQ